MIKSVIKGYGYYVPDNVVTNDDLSKLMTTNDEWITERTGIKERRHRKNRNDSEETTAFLSSQKLCLSQNFSVQFYHNLLPTSSLKPVVHYKKGCSSD